MSSYIRRLSLMAILTAIGVIIAPFIWFPVLMSKAYPGQHMINVIAGILLGPLWAALIAVTIGIIRMFLGIGTIYSIPGGVPGAVLVGFTYNLMKRSTKFKKYAELAAFTEPLGTVFIGGTLSLLVLAPIIGDARMLSRLEEGIITALLFLWSGWALSSIPGSIIGFLIVSTINRFKHWL